MEQAKMVAKAVLRNSDNPQLAWLLFKRTLASNIKDCSFSQHTLSLIVPILIRAHMFSQVDYLHRHLLLFPTPPHHALYSFVKMLAEAGRVQQAFSQFQSLRARLARAPPSILLYNLLIRASIKQNCPNYVSWLYKDIIFSKVKLQTYTFNLLIGTLCDAGRLEDARHLFDRMPDRDCQPNEYTFGILARGYCRDGLVDKGLELLDLMKTMALVPTAVIYNTFISGFCKEGKDDEAERLVERMKEDGLSPNVVTFNTRISALCKAGKILEASRIFRDMQTSELGLPMPNAVTYNLMLDGFYREGMSAEAEALVISMKRDAIFSSVESYNIWLLGLVRTSKLFEAQAVLKGMVNDGVQPNAYSYNILINGLCKNGMLADARRVVSLMITGGVSPDVTTYSALLQGYCRKGRNVEANKILNEMIRAGCSPNAYTYNILLHSLWREGRTAEAERLMQKMNERGDGLDTVSCNIVIDGLCRSGNVDKAVEIASEMWTHGSAALGNLGNSYIGLVDENRKKCLPDLITYSTIIKGLCRDGRLEEAKKKFTEMLGRNLYPDSTVYDIFLYNLCKRGKISSAFQVLKDMERKGCNKTLRTYNCLIFGLGVANQIYEMFGQLDEMKERGVSPNVSTYNIILNSLCEGQRSEEAAFILDEMLQKGVTPNLNSYKSLIKTFCRTGEFRPAQDVFEIAISVCGHKEVLYTLMFNELLLGGEILEAKQLFEAAIERCFDLGSFSYKDLIDKLCVNEKFDHAHDILKKMVQRGCRFDPALFMPVIDYLLSKGNKHEVNELTERMLAMGSNVEVKTMVHKDDKQLNHGRQHKDSGSDWQTILHRYECQTGIVTSLYTLLWNSCLLKYLALGVSLTVFHIFYFRTHFTYCLHSVSVTFSSGISTSFFYPVFLTEMMEVLWR
ncbi:pentatricopeptide repeat-containing protein At2g17140 isoform X1 [Salvia miltiorrhiza]|uniref:pentatricopeptide repeat-containing protein At2g17140 isoform X1 n=1 Tax=Salvia miltiorrhiza TaxID=226208 RepID=UPI0025AC5690|nr:pentatricopeptide repeat-containing protein At2g17140 isoform X1 [Salvia miltiorrhiza]